MKLRVALLVTVLAVAGCMIFWSARVRESEVLLSSIATLTPEWQEFTPSHPFETDAPWNEIVVELPTHDYRTHHRLLLDDGTELKIDGYLITDAHERITLDQVAPMAFGDKTVVDLSTEALQWKQQHYRFRTLALRSNSSVRAGKIIWLSYDPRDTHDGVMVPRALQ